MALLQFSGQVRGHYISKDIRTPVNGGILPCVQEATNRFDLFARKVAL